MIELHRRKDDLYADELEERLRNLVVAYRAALHDEDISEPTSLPYISESGKLITGEKNIERYFIELEKELNWQRSLSGDGCYIDPDSGNIC